MRNAVLTSCTEKGLCGGLAALITPSHPTRNVTRSFAARNHLFVAIVSVAAPCPAHRRPDVLVSSTRTTVIEGRNFPVPDWRVLLPRYNGVILYVWVIERSKQPTSHHVKRRHILLAQWRCAVPLSFTSPTLKLAPWVFGHALPSLRAAEYEHDTSGCRLRKEAPIVRRP
jgi:hypothetical protein